MQKRIFLNFAGLILVCVLLLATSFGLLFFAASQTYEMESTRDKTHLVAGLLNQGNFDYIESLDSGSTRITIISPDGWVLWDSHAGADFTDNRSNRTEFVQALYYGSGEAIRSSDTLDAETFYHATRLSDGNVLRLSRTLYSLGEVFTSTLPTLIIVTTIILILAYIAAHRLTKRIIKPLLAVDFENIGSATSSTLNNSLYEELWPYVKKIDQQKQELASQLTALKNRAETIETIISNMREGLVILDEKGLILTANESALDIFSIHTKKGIAQKNIQHVYRDPEFTQAVKECIEGTHSEISFTRNDKMYKAFLNPVASEKGNRGAIIFFLDTTVQFKADKQRREFTANVSHELKTPLTTISALSEMMANGMVKTEDVVGFADKISSHTKRLINIIDDIIKLSEFDESKVEKNFTAFDIYELAKSVVSNLQDKADEKSVAIELTGHPLQLKANSRLLDELIYNLIDNGIKYNKDGGHVTLDIHEENGGCKISVSDTGIGIPKEHQDRIFERFYRVDSSRSVKTGGTGLGLSIVKHITEYHGGTVSLQSEKGVGTTIVCNIPSI